MKRSLVSVLLLIRLDCLKCLPTTLDHCCRHQTLGRFIGRDGSVQVVEQRTLVFRLLRTFAWSLVVRDGGNEVGTGNRWLASSPPPCQSRCAELRPRVLRTRTSASR